jgi:hypothetical protein
MKKIFIVETTSSEYWEMNHGFHLVKAETKQGAIKAVQKVITGETVVKVETIDEMLRSGFHSVEEGRVRTIIGSQTM